MISKTTTGWLYASEGNTWSISALWTLSLYSNRRIIWDFSIADGGSHTMYPGCMSWALICCRAERSLLRLLVFRVSFRDIESVASVCWMWFLSWTPHIQLYVGLQPNLSQLFLFLAFSSSPNQIMSFASFLTPVLPCLAECRIVRASSAAISLPSFGFVTRITSAL